jgi:hypothetical protein
MRSITSARVMPSGMTRALNDAAPAAVLGYHLKGQSAVERVDKLALLKRHKVGLQRPLMAAMGKRHYYLGKAFVRCQLELVSYT